MILSLKDLAGALRNADPADKAEVYAELGIRVRYEPGERVIVAQAQPTLACSHRRVGGGT